MPNTRVAHKKSLLSIGGGGVKQDKNKIVKWPVNMKLDHLMNSDKNGFIGAQWMAKL